MKYLFVAGAPGSRWSSVARSIYASPRIDRSDGTDSYTRPGETVPMHVGSYWDPGMPYGNNFDNLSELSKEQAEQEFDRPFQKQTNLTRIIKSHQFCKHLDYLKDNWPMCPIVLVYYKNDDVTESWWYEAGGFDITYPDYSWYKNQMRQEIEVQNAGVLDFVKNNNCVQVTNSTELENILGFKELEHKDFGDVDVYVYLPHLINYFGKQWSGNLTKYKYSGPALIDKIDTDASVLDVGCGENYFKRHFKNLIGIDPSNKKADYIVSLEEFKTDTEFDAVLCLGSLNFGSEETVYNQVQRAVELTRKGGTLYWRCNPGLHDHPWEGQDKIDFFEWSFDIHEKWSRQLGCELLQCTWDTGNRIYAEWRKT